MKRIITYGTFDLLHYGHTNLLKRAKALGDYLVVALSTDDFNWKEKKKKCYFSFEKRKQLLEAIRYVDLVIPEENWEQKRADIKEYHIDAFVSGASSRAHTKSCSKTAASVSPTTAAWTCRSRARYGARWRPSVKRIGG